LVLAGCPEHQEVRVKIEVEDVTSLRFEDGSPVRAASAVARFGDGLLVAQDDATHGAWLRNGAVRAVRILPAVEGLETFDEATGTKHLKPDLEAACELVVEGEPAVLLLGSGSTPARMRSSLMRLDDGEPRPVVADLSLLYASVARTLDVDPEELNMEGACVVGAALRWFQRGLPSAGIPTASVDLDLSALLAAVGFGADVSSVAVTHPVHYDLGDVDGVGLAVTDAVFLDGQELLVSAAAEDAPNARDDGPVVGAALALLDGEQVRDMSELPDVDGKAPKVEGLTVLERDDASVRVLATVDADDPEACSLAVRLRVRW
jgi:hypothetical protein